MCFCHFGLNRQNRGQKWWLAKGHRKADHHVVTTRINRPVTIVQYHLLRKTVVENNKNIMKIMAHCKLNIYCSFHSYYGNHIHGQKIRHFTFHRGKKGRVRKLPFTTLFSMLLLITIIIIAVTFGHDHVIAS